MRTSRGHGRSVLAGAGALVLLAAAAAGCSGRAGAVHGHATVDGTGAAGAEIRFFVRAGEERSGAPFATAIAAGDGSFRVSLPPGTYFVVARKTVRDGGRDRTFKGDYRGNPVVLAAGGTVGGIDIPLAEMSSAGFVPQAATGLTGTVSSGGRAAPGVHVYAYPADSGTVRGPSYAAFARTDAAGRFRLALRAGSFLVVARRKGGTDETGAMTRDGQSGGGEGKAVMLSAGETKDVGVLALRAPREESRRVRADAGGQDASSAAIGGAIVREDGSPQEGVYVMAYADRRMIGRPYAVSGRTGRSGRFSLRLPRPGTFYLGARSERGGPLSPGEWVGTYDGAPDHAVAVGAGEARDDLRIRVSEKW